MNQTINGYRVQTMTHKPTGNRFVIINGNLSRCVPLEIASLAAGKDAWMRDILAPCSDCKTHIKLGEMECNLCPDCYDKALQD